MVGIGQVSCRHSHIHGYFHKSIKPYLPAGVNAAFDPFQGVRRIQGYAMTFSRRRLKHGDFFPT
jgi:hypothetical protein